MSFVQLTNDNKSASAKQVFIEQIQKFNIPQSTADQIFNGLIEHNKQALTKLLDECIKNNSKIAKDIEIIALNMLIGYYKNLESHQMKRGKKKKI